MVKLVSREAIKGVPLVGPTLSWGRRELTRRRFHGSAGYWQQRYAAGGNSGDGSYGEEARFKAEVLNGFVAEHQISSVLEFGCGDGHQLSLGTYPRYLGLDVAAGAVDLCMERFRGDPTRSFLWFDPARFVNRGGVTAELAMSLDVLYHLVEDAVFDRHLRQLFDASSRYVAIYSSDVDQPSEEPHVRHRRFTAWVEAHQPTWRALQQVPNPIEQRLTAASFHFYERVPG